MSSPFASTLASPPPSPTRLLKKHVAPRFQHSLVPFGCLSVWACAASSTCLLAAAQLLQQPCADKAILFVSTLAWVLYLYFLVYHSLWWTPLWQRSAPHHMVSAYGVLLPLLIWQMEDTMPLGRGYPGIEAVVIIGFQVRLQLLPFRGVLGLSLLFLTITIANYVWSCLPLGWTLATVIFQFCPVVILNFCLGLGFSCIIGLARNRQTTSAAASPTTQREGSNFMCLKFLLQAEQWLLSVVPAATAEAALASLSAVYVSLFFIGSCINFSIRNTLPDSPTMNMLVILLAMYWGSSDTQHQKNLVVAQAHAYNIVRSLLHNVVPAHIANRMENLKAHEALLCDSDPDMPDTRAASFDQQHSHPHSRRLLSKHSFPARGRQSASQLSFSSQLSSSVAARPTPHKLQRSVSHDLSVMHAQSSMSLLPKALHALKASAGAVVQHVGSSRSSFSQPWQPKEEGGDEQEQGWGVNPEVDLPRVSLELLCPQRESPGFWGHHDWEKRRGRMRRRSHGSTRDFSFSGSSRGFPFSDARQSQGGARDFSFSGSCSGRQQEQQPGEACCQPPQADQSFERHSVHFSVDGPYSGPYYPASRGPHQSQVQRVLQGSHSDPLGEALPRSMDADNDVELEHICCSEQHECVSVCFSDVVGFTSLSEQLRPAEVMALLSNLYAQYDAVAKSLNLYTVDTVGDCYMCAANLIQPIPNHAEVMVTFAKRILDIATHTLTPLGQPLVTRVGIHSGSVMSGILGESRMKFTLVGDTVNTASRMESMPSQHDPDQQRHLRAPAGMLKLTVRSRSTLHRERQWTA